MARRWRSLRSGGSDGLGVRMEGTLANTMMQSKVEGGDNEEGNLVMLLAAVHSDLFLCLPLSTECVVSASEQVFNPDEWRGINAFIIIMSARH